MTSCRITIAYLHYISFLKLHKFNAIISFVLYFSYDNDGEKHLITCGLDNMTTTDAPLTSLNHALIKVENGYGACVVGGMGVGDMSD